jgi:hypothetical protein
MISSNDSPSTSRGASTGGKGALQAPQRPVSARWAAGMRFFLSQILHVRITDIHILQLRTGTGHRHAAWSLDEEIADPISCFRRSFPGSSYDRGEFAWLLQRRNFVVCGSWGFSRAS